MNGDGESLEALGFGALNDVLQHGFARDRQEGFGRVLGLGFQPSATAACHDDHEVVPGAERQELVPGVQADDLSVIIHDGQLVNRVCSHEM
jgi:hypothetical protein